MSQKFNNDKYDLDNGKLKEFAQHNPTIIGEPRQLEPADVDRRIGGLPKVLEYAYAWITTGSDQRTAEQQDIPLLLICSMARQSGFMESYATSRVAIGLDFVVESLRAR